MPMSATLGAIGLLAEEDPTRTHSWIFPEGPELIWGTLSFLIVAFLLWKFAWPQAKQMMQDRTGRIQTQLDEAAAAKAGAEEAATSIRAEAETELAEYNAAVAQVRVEANARIDAARQTLEGERQARLAQVNNEVAARRSAAAAEAEAAKAAAREQVITAGAQVAAVASGRVLGRSVDPAAARAAVEAAMSAEVS